MALPNTYKEVEYIESSGTQRIDTGINVSNDITYGFECKMGFAQISTGTGCIMDMGNTSTDNGRYGISYYYNTSSSTGGWQFGYTNSSNPYWGYEVTGYGPTTGTDFTLSYNINGDKVGKINGTSVITGMSISNISYANNWNIFCQTYSSTYTRYGTFKLYYMKIYHGSTLVRDFIPVLRKSDNKPGLYDLVNDVFYTNAGTGEFEYPLQGGKIKKIYIGDKLVRPSTLVVHFPFENDELDYSSNKVSMTSYGTKSFTTLSSGKKVLNASAWQLLSGTNFISKYLSDHVYTVCYWVNPTKDYTYRRNHFTIGGYIGQGSMEIGATTYNTQGTWAGLEKIYFDGNPGSQSLSGWRNIVITINKGSGIAYINGVQYTTGSRASVADGILGIGNGGANSSNDRLTGYISEFSIELGNWNQQKITEYFNNTKSLYGIS